MKKLIAWAAIFIIALPAYTQAYLDTVSIPEPYEIVIVDRVPGIDNLYSKARLFFAEAYRNAKYVVDLEDATTQIIIGKSYFDIYLHPFGDEKKAIRRYGQTDYKVKVECRDDRYRLTFYGFDYTRNAQDISIAVGYDLTRSYADSKAGKKHIDAWERVRKQVVLQCRQWAADFKLFLEKQQTTNF